MELQRTGSGVCGARAGYVSTFRTHNNIYLSGVRDERGACSRVPVGRFSGFDVDMYGRRAYVRVFMGVLSWD